MRDGSGDRGHREIYGQQGSVEYLHARRRASRSTF